MTQRLPIPGQDDGTWGNVLNGYLEVSHNADGTLIPSAVTAAGAGTYSKPSSGIPSTDLDSGTQTTLTTVSGKYTKPGSGIPATDLTTAVQTNLTSASTAIQTVNSKSGTTITLVPSDIGAPTTLAALTDVSGASGATNAQVLAYNTTTSKWVPSTVSSSTVSDATTGAKGIVQLAGDLSGTAAAPTLASTTNVNSIIAANSTVTSKAPLASPTFTGTVTAPTLTSTSHVTTNLQVTTGSPASGKVLTSDSSGNASWVTPAAGAGNATTSAPGIVQLAGDLAGTATAPTVAKVNGITVTGTPSANQVLTASTSTAASWVTPAAGAGNATTSTPGVVQLAGDLSGTATAPTVAKVNGITVTGTPATGNVLTASSTTAATWAVAASAPVASVFTRTGAITAQTGDYTFAQVGAAQATTPLSSPVTAAYTASAGDFVPVNAAGGTVVVKLPNAPADKSRVIIKLVSASSETNVATIQTQGSDVFDITGGATSATLILQNQAKTFQYQTSTGIWYAAAVDLPLSSLVTGTCRTVTNTYTLSSTDHVILADATSGSFTVTLPTATTFGGRFTINAITSSTNIVTIGTTSSQTIDGSSTTTVGTQASGAPWTSIDLISDGSNWRSV